MALSLHQLHPAKGSKKSPKRVGRGLGSTGSYSGRGVKGQGARSGVSGLKLKGLRQIMLKIPKRRGFQSGQPKPSVVNLGKINKSFPDGAVVTPKALLKINLVSHIESGVKILADGELTKKFQFKGCQTSATAKAKIEQAGGSISE